MCGVVDGGIVAGSFGYEAGQSGVGDIFAWFVTRSVPASYAEARAPGRPRPCTSTSPALAARQEVGEHGLVALDWHSGNRSVLVDHELSGLVVGLTLATTSGASVPRPARGDGLRHPGHRRGVPRCRSSGRGVHRCRRFAQEHLADADLLRRAGDAPQRHDQSTMARPSGPPSTPLSQRAAYPDVAVASEAMGRRQVAAYHPDPRRSERYDELFADYLALHEQFGRESPLMRRLRARRRTALAGAPSTPQEDSR